MGKEPDYQINLKKATFQFSVVVFGQIGETENSSEISEEYRETEEENKDILGLRKDNAAIQKSKGRALWWRLRTMVKLTRRMLYQSNPSLVLISGQDGTTSAWSKMKTVVTLTKMANRLLALRNQSRRAGPPRGGGYREKGSFDTLGTT